MEIDEEDDGTRLPPVATPNLSMDYQEHIRWVLKIKENRSLVQEVEILKEKLEQKFSFEKTIIGQSSAIKNVFTKINKALNNNINVSITGETGTGKGAMGAGRKTKKACGC